MPLIYLGIGWFIGLWATSALHLPAEALLAFTLVPIIGLVLWRGDRRARVIWLGMLFAVFGGLRYLVSVPHFDQSSLSTYNNTGEVTLEGVIEAAPDVRDTYINLRVSVLAHDQGSPILAALFAFRDQARRVITQILPEPQGSLLNGILLGDDAGLPASVQDEFRATGTIPGTDQREGNSRERAREA